jgi:hypothetical protein
MGAEWALRKIALPSSSFSFPLSYAEPQQTLKVQTENPIKSFITNLPVSMRRTLKAQKALFIREGYS